jgi:hypothetical protein
MWCISDVSQLHNLYYVSVFMFLVHTLIMIFAYDNKLICKGRGNQIQTYKGTNLLLLPI